MHKQLQNAHVEQPQVSADGCMYVDNLIAAWGEIHNVSAEDVLTALRKYHA